MKKRVFLETVIYLVIILFIYASFYKLLDHRVFALQIDKSPLFDLGVSKILAWVIPMSEIGVVLLLFTMRYRRVGLYAALVLMVTFTGYIAFNLLFTQYRACACGGILNEMGFEEHLVFNLVFVVLIVIAIRLDSKVRIDGHVLSQSTT